VCLAKRKGRKKGLYLQWLFKLMGADDFTDYLVPKENSRPLRKRVRVVGEEEEKLEEPRHQS